MPRGFSDLIPDVHLPEVELQLWWTRQIIAAAHSLLARSSSSSTSCGVCAADQDLRPGTLCLERRPSSGTSSGERSGNSDRWLSLYPRRVRPSTH